MKKTININAFDFTTVHTALALGEILTDEMKKAVKEYNNSQIDTDLSRKYFKVSVHTTDGRIDRLQRTASVYAELPEAAVKAVDTLYKAAEAEGKTPSRKKIHQLILDINATLPKSQQIKLTTPIEKGLTDCLNSRRMIGYKYVRKLSEVCKVIVRTYWAALNKKPLEVAYKGLD